MTQMSNSKHDVPGMIFMLLFYAVLCVGAGMCFKLGWSLIG